MPPSSNLVRHGRYSIGKLTTSCAEAADSLHTSHISHEVLIIWDLLSIVRRVCVPFSSDPAVNNIAEYVLKKGAQLGRLPLAYVYSCSSTVANPHGSSEVYPGRSPLSVSPPMLLQSLLSRTGPKSALELCFGRATGPFAQPWIATERSLASCDSFPAQKQNRPCCSEIRPSD